MQNQAASPRYQRQILLPEIGMTGQQLLLDAKVLVIGAGGLGCPALQYLVAAGVGTIGIVDGDQVEITNLHRQLLYTMDDIGQSKAMLAKTKLMQLNPGCNINAHQIYLDKLNACDLIEPYDIILDGSDNFATRYLVNDVCVLMHKPLVYGAVYRFEGQLAVFNYLQPDGTYSAQYRDLFPEPPGENSIPNCAEAGVLGVLPGIIGTMQANEVIKLITNSGKLLVNALFTYQALTNQTYEIAFEPTAAGREAVPASRNELAAMEYAIDCKINSESNIIPINAAEFDSLITDKNISIIDVRETGELPFIDLFKHINIPLSVLNKKAINADSDIVLFCQSGVRSKTAANMIASNNKSNYNIYNLEGGITAWLAYKNESL